MNGIDQLDLTMWEGTPMGFLDSHWKLGDMEMQEVTEYHMLCDSSCILCKNK